MEKEKLTKSQRRRAHERARKEQIRDMLPVPDHILEDGRQNGNLCAFNELAPWEKAPPHMIEISDDGLSISLNDKKIAELSGHAGINRAQERQQKIKQLQFKYPDDWGKRGRAKYIASCETVAGNQISERTIQQYFSETK